jgi:hypothetical protein
MERRGFPTDLEGNEFVDVDDGQPLTVVLGALHCEINQLFLLRHVRLAVLKHSRKRDDQDMIC